MLETYLQPIKFNNNNKVNEDCLNITSKNKNERIKIKLSFKFISQRIVKTKQELLLENIIK